jgi:hypothetical protein
VDFLLVPVLYRPLGAREEEDDDDERKNLAQMRSCVQTKLRISPFTSPG